MVRLGCLVSLPSVLLEVEAPATGNTASNPDPPPNPDRFAELIAKKKMRHCRNITAGLIASTTSTSSGR
jgi:hypothetical protein